MYRPNLQSVALPVSEVISITVLGWGCEPPILWKGSHRGSGMVPFERALVSSFRRYMVTFRLSTCFRDIAALCSSPARHFFAIPPLVSPKFPHVSWV